MTARLIQTSIYEHTCDECGKAIQGESSPAYWTGVQIESFAAAGGRYGIHLDLCADCIALDKYSWTRP